MEFNGAVLVDNKKIRNACDSYRTWCNDYNKDIVPVARKVAEKYKTLSWWTTMFDSRWDSEFYKVMKHVHKLNDFRKSHLECLYMVELIGHSLYDKYADIEDYLSPSNSRMCSNLQSMIKCGEPVYLTPEQCKFVNMFYKENE